MVFTEKTVPLDSIDMQDKAFVATAGRPVQDLKNSIGRIGLVNPPWLVFSESKGCFQVVSGYRRVKALGGLGWDRVPAKVFDPQTEAKKLLVFSWVVRHTAVITSCLRPERAESIRTASSKSLGLFRI